VFKPFVYANRDLRRESMSSGEYRCADNGGKSGIDERLTADYHKGPIRLGIVSGLVNAVKFSSPHSCSSLLLYYRLIAEYVFYLCIQFICSLVEEFQIACLDLRPPPFA